MRTWAEAGTRRSREGRIQVGRSGGLTRCGLGPEPDPRLSYQAGTWLIWSRTGRVRVGRSGSQHAPHAADLPERAWQAESESDEAGAHKHHRWPRPEPDPHTVAGPEQVRSDRPSPSRMEREPYTLRTWAGAEPNWAGAD